MQSVLKDSEDKMNKAVENLKREFGRLRTGRASTALVENIKVDYYGTPTPLPQISSIAVPDSRSITIQPWDRNAFSLIDKAIQTSDLGLSAVNDGKVLRINIPPLTEERRKELVKLAKKYTEETKVAVRNIRRDGNETLKKKEKDKDITQDDLHKGQDEIQKLTDGYIKKAEQVLGDKEKEIMEI
ncbi:Ribosome-recycling factor [Desulfovibrio sp. X2]|uniref:ribosome recycling factor n=1 Tax=Desulfovibrio sp. X2 TaxID=941449 RepID=UPI00035879B9|nr:ribosome recycling factor [Desulfovibrio sp. X2]EPR44336.1 Ribosome-recycling factor [Desulfovibrio sp. X2]